LSQSRITRFRRRLAEATVKRLTGGDMIKAHYMRKDFVVFQPSHTAVLVTNHLPKVSGDDPALWARLRVVPFEVVIPEKEQDRKLAEKLELEADAILSWLVWGWQQYRDGGLKEPEEVEAATAKYKADSDSLTQFLEEKCHIGNVLQVKVSDLWDAWTRFCKANGFDAGTQREFGQMLERKGFDAKKGGRGARFRVGLSLQTAEEDDSDPF
jgi:putative DNA primase/helicase